MTVKRPEIATEGEQAFPRLHREEIRALYSIVMLVRIPVLIQQVQEAFRHRCFATPTGSFQDFPVPSTSVEPHYFGPSYSATAKRTRRVAYSNLQRGRNLDLVFISAHNLDTRCFRAQRNVRQRPQLPTLPLLPALSQNPVALSLQVLLPPRLQSKLPLQLPVNLPPLLPAKRHRALAFPRTRHGSPQIASSSLLLLPPLLLRKLPSPPPSLSALPPMAPYHQMALPAQGPLPAQTPSPHPSPVHSPRPHPLSKLQKPATLPSQVLNPPSQTQLPQSNLPNRNLQVLCPTCAKAFPQLSISSS